MTPLRAVVVRVAAVAARLRPGWAFPLDPEGTTLVNVDLLEGDAESFPPEDVVNVGDDVLVRRELDDELLARVGEALAEED